MANSYDKGKTIRFSGVFTSNGVVSDPTNVLFKVKYPSDTIYTYNYLSGTVSKTSTGRYYKDLLMDEVGQVWYQFSSTGVLVTAEETYLIINPSEFD